MTNKTRCLGNYLFLLSNDISAISFITVVKTSVFTTLSEFADKCCAQKIPILLPELISKGHADEIIRRKILSFKEIQLIDATLLCFIIGNAFLANLLGIKQEST